MACFLYIKAKNVRPTEQLSCDQLKGSQIINLDQLQKYIGELITHAVKCSSQIILNGEKKDGLVSVLFSLCSRYSFDLNISRKEVGPNGKLRREANLAAVWGQMSTGGGYSKLKETMSTLDVPVMSPKNFICTERDIGQWWQDHLQDVMAEAGRKEKQLAEEQDDYHQGVPCITVIVDGGWSKRSHRHSYNAKSGLE